MRTIDRSGAAALVFMLLPVSVAAQADARSGSDTDRRQFRRGPDIETIMSQGERLELTEDQMQALDEIRADQVAERSAVAAEMAEMRSQLRAGLIRRSEMMAFLEDRRDAAGDRSQDRRSQLESILTAEQQEQLATLRMRARAGQRARVGMRGNRGPRAFGQRGARGFDRARRGSRDRRGRG